MLHSSAAIKIISLSCAGAPDELLMLLAASSNAISEGFDATSYSAREFHSWTFLIPCCRINVWVEVESSEETGKSKPHICVSKISTRTDPT